MCANVELSILTKLVEEMVEPMKEFTHVITQDSEYYKNGPQQMTPPDGTFTAGTKVRLLSEAGSYSQVEAENGIVAYVAADNLKPLGKGS